MSIVLSNSIAAKRPDLVEYWDWEKNEKSPESISCGSRQTVHWKCKDYSDHTWATPAFRQCGATQSKCPYCNGRKVKTGFNDLFTVHPELECEWDYEHNIGIDPRKLKSHSHKSVQWVCSKHNVRWTAKVYDRAKGKGCPACRAEKISLKRSSIKNGQSLSSCFPDVAAQWDYDLNEKVPDEVPPHAKMEAHWVCLKHDEPYRWTAHVYSRTCGKPSGCPKCAIEQQVKRQATPATEESLASVFPESANEWAYDLNDGLTPYDIYPSSNKAFWWRCSICHETEWRTTPSNKTSGGYFHIGCSQCAHRRMKGRMGTPKSGSLLIDERPDLALEWNEERNSILGFHLCDAATHSNKIVWWKGKCGHEWMASVNHRTSRGDGCPTCGSRFKVSYPEKAIYFYIHAYFADAVANYKDKSGPIGNLELDVWVPSIKHGVEYDGHFWHQDIERDKKKDLACLEAGITLIRIRECGCPEYEGGAIKIARQTIYDAWSLDEAIAHTLAMLGVEQADVDTARDEARIRELIPLSGKEEACNTPLLGATS